MKSKYDKIFVKYTEVLIDFIDQDGIFMVYSEDKLFFNLLNRLLIKYIGVQKNCIVPVLTQQEIFDHLGKTSKLRQKVILFLERVQNGFSSANLIPNIKAGFDHCKVIVLSTEVERDVLVSLYEAGADNIITKPISINVLLEKVAFTLKPSSKIGELLDNARAMLKKKQYEQALKKIEEVLAIKPQSASALMLRGDIFRDQGKLEEAIAEYKAALKSSPLYLEPIKRLIAVYDELGDSEKKLKYMLRLDRLNPLNVARKLELGSIFVELGKKDQGEPYLEQALKLASKEARDNLGQLAVQIADRLMSVDAELAERYYRRALQVKGNRFDLGDLETFNRLGICLRQQKKPDLAIEEYQKALRIAPDNERLLYNIAMAYLEAGRFQKAWDSIDRLLQIAPDFYLASEVVSFNIGMIYYRNKEWEKARHFFKKALEINSGYQPAAKMLQRMEQ